MKPLRFQKYVHGNEKIELRLKYGMSCIIASNDRFFIQDSFYTEHFDDSSYFLYFRLSEIITLVSVSTTLFLYIQTRELAHRLNDIKRPYDEGKFLRKSAHLRG